MSQIQRSKRKAIWRRLWREAWFWGERLFLVWRVAVMLREARTLERELQRLKQKRDDLLFAGARQQEEYLVAKGFCEGVEFCLQRRWKKNLSEEAL